METRYKAMPQDCKKKNHFEAGEIQEYGGNLLSSISSLKTIYQNNVTLQFCIDRPCDSQIRDVRRLVKERSVVSAKSEGR